MNIYVFLCLINIIALSLAIYYIATRRGQNKTTFLLLSLFAAFLMVIDFLFEVTATDINVAKKALYAQFIGYNAFGVFFTLEIFKACGRNIKNRYIVAGMLYTLALFLIGFTNDIHGLYYDQFFFNLSENGNYVLTYTHGIIGIIGLVISYFFIVLATFNILIHYSRWNKVLKRQLNYFLGGVGISVFIHSLEIVGLINTDYILTYFQLSFAVLVYTYGIYRKGVLDIEALAIEMSMNSVKSELLVLDKNWHFIYANNSAMKRYSAVNNLLQGDSIDNVEFLPDKLKKLHDIGTYEFEYKDGDKKYYMQYTVDTLSQKEKIIGYIISFSDITAIKNSLIEAEAIAHTDALVKTYNRRGFFYKLNEVKIDQLNSTGMLLIDIDHFKHVNDNFGHDIGDLVLIKLGEILTKSLDDTNIVARYGGEEFIIAVTDSSPKEVLKYAEEIRVIIEKYNFEKVGNITVSIGVTMCDSQKTISETIKRSDEALYTAKQVSRNAVYYYDFDDKIKPYTNVKNSMKVKNSFSELNKIIKFMPFKVVIWNFNKEFICASNEFINMLKTDIKTYSENPQKFDVKDKLNKSLEEKLIIKDIKNLGVIDKIELNGKYLNSNGEVIPTNVVVKKTNYQSTNIIVMYVEEVIK